jgi:hypothetical protein
MPITPDLSGALVLRRLSFLIGARRAPLLRVVRRYLQFGGRPLVLVTFLGTLWLLLSRLGVLPRLLDAHCSPFT